MPNQYIQQRLEGIHKSLMALHDGTKEMSDATKGGERENFVKMFLEALLPPIYRFGRGDITDSGGNKSGQVDIVIEYPFFPSFSLVDRLYFCEGVAAVIEVKSQIDKEWHAVINTAQKIKGLKRRFGMTTSFGKPPSTIPVFAVGYTGWSTSQTVLSKLKDNADIDSILIIDSGIFCAKNSFPVVQANQTWGLWGFILAIHSAVSKLQSAHSNLLEYMI